MLVSTFICVQDAQSCGCTSSLPRSSSVAGADQLVRPSRRLSACKRADGGDCAGGGTGSKCADIPAKLMAFSPDLERWWRAGTEYRSRTEKRLGRALSETGQFAAALPWYERAVEAKQKGDTDGRVDHDEPRSQPAPGGLLLFEHGPSARRSPGSSAPSRQQKGDIHGRVDHESLGRSLYQVGLCYRAPGEYAEAQPWFERAVEANRTGDIHGRVDHESLGGACTRWASACRAPGRSPRRSPGSSAPSRPSRRATSTAASTTTSLGRSLHQVGFCWRAPGQFAEAQPWFERAVEAEEKGDIHGRVDHERRRSLHQVGFCFASRAVRGGAPWFERAVEAARRATSTAASITRASAKACTSGLLPVGPGKFAAAHPWFERAVAADGKGDVHRRDRLHKPRRDSPFRHTLFKATRARHRGKRLGSAG